MVAILVMPNKDGTFTICQALLTVSQNYYTGVSQSLQGFLDKETEAQKA